MTTVTFDARALGKSWQHLGTPLPGALAAARLELHWAAQTVAAAGNTHGHRRPDDSHTNMEWLGAHGALVGHPSATTPSFRAGIDFRHLALLVLDAEGAASATLELAGKTLDDAYRWLEATIAEQLGTPPAPLARPTYELPDSPLASGDAFSPDHGPALAELCRWFANADRAFRQVTAAFENRAPVRCWPHHFDIATLITLAAGADPESSRTVGAGMTPGDTSYAEPYIYVTPWPYPDQPTPGPLAGGGAWHQEGWFGAVLSGSTLAADATAEAQASRLTAFLESAIDQCIALQES